jgi:hypothetical protein
LAFHGRRRCLPSDFSQRTGLDIPVPKLGRVRIGRQKVGFGQEWELPLSDWAVRRIGRRVRLVAVILGVAFSIRADPCSTPNPISVQPRSAKYRKRP